MLSRRLILCTGAMPASLPAFAVEADPVFAAIAVAVEADDALTAALDGLDENDRAALARADEAADRSGDAIRALSEVTPTTGAGLRALIRHYADDVARQDIFSAGAVCLAHLARIVEVQPPPG